ncbi:MAG: type II toxin-antitoxin system PemK/MazF family toxin [Arenibacter algicola]|nr:type II toxin-antitoxin system PemK/MazF family toxin [Arenibacter algicola]
MPIPDPFPGLVVGYSYLWRHEHRSGEEGGRKDRPCAIVLVSEQVDGETVVIVVPITHTSPQDDETAVELPPETKKRMGMDDQPSWVMVNEVNRFIWPGPDLRPIPNANPRRFDYGVLPPKLFKKITSAMEELRSKKRLTVVPR